MDLYVMRPGAGLSHDIDPARPLSPVAREQVHKAANTLSRLGTTFEAMACAPSLRASQTAKIMAGALGFPERAIASGKALSGTGQVDEAMDFLAALTPARTMLCCAHAPLVEHLASTLIFGGPAGRIRFEPGALAMIEIPELPTRVAILRWLLPPAHLRLLASL
ncbi:MAG: hypothetical protein GYA47_12200 [Desulfovibrio sp.]|nr:hypothetical protein [Desulfovibrio sp.]